MAVRGRSALLVIVTACTNTNVDEVPADVCGDGTRDELEQCDDGNRLGGDGCSELCSPEPLVTVEWTFYPTLGGPPLVGACPDGIATVELVTSINTTAEVPCTAERTAKIFVPQGAQVLARLRAADRAIVAESLPERPISGWRASAVFYADAGYIRASFALPQACLAPSIVLTVTPAGGTSVAQTFPCMDDVALVVSAPLLAGTYDVALTDTFGQTFERPGVTVRANTGVTDLDFR